MHPLEQKLALAWPPERWRDVSIVGAVSGGADSVALVRLLAAIKAIAGGSGRLHVAHFNHGWRGAESDADADFVAALAERLGLPCHVGRADGNPVATTTSHGDRREGRARDERYTFLRQTAEQCGARYVVTAHTADDQAETILHHILRGTGLSGLAGMRRVRDLGPAATLIRPLLEVRRAELLDYLAAVEQDFRTDATNADVRYTRSRIRHELLPRIEAEIQPRAVEAICRLGQLAGEAHEVLSDAAERLLARHAVITRDQLTIECRGLDLVRPYLVREMLVAAWRKLGWPQQEMTLARWEELADFVQANSSPERSAVSLPGSLLARRAAAAITISRTGA